MTQVSGDLTGSCDKLSQVRPRFWKSFVKMLSFKSLKPSSTNFIQRTFLGRDAFRGVRRMSPCVSVTNVFLRGSRRFWIRRVGFRYPRRVRWRLRERPACIGSRIRQAGIKTSSLSRVGWNFLGGVGWGPLSGVGWRPRRNTTRWSCRPRIITAPILRGVWWGSGRWPSSLRLLVIRPPRGLPSWVI